jgi:hypothetical protein
MLLFLHFMFYIWSICTSVRMFNVFLLSHVYGVCIVNVTLTRFILIPCSYHIMISFFFCLCCWCFLLFCKSSKRSFLFLFVPHVFVCYFFSAVGLLFFLLLGCYSLFFLFFFFLPLRFITCSVRICGSQWRRKKKKKRMFNVHWWKWLFISFIHVKRTGGSTSTTFRRPPAPCEQK